MERGKVKSQNHFLWNRFFISPCDNQFIIFRQVWSYRRLGVKFVPSHYETRSFSIWRKVQKKTAQPMKLMNFLRLIFVERIMVFDKGAFFYRRWWSRLMCIISHMFLAISPNTQELWLSRPLTVKLPMKSFGKSQFIRIKSSVSLMNVRKENSRLGVEFLGERRFRGTIWHRSFDLRV